MMTEDLTEDYPEDVTTVKRVIEKNGISCTRRQALLAWERYSASMDAGWLGVSTDDAFVWTRVYPFLAKK